MLISAALFGMSLHATEIIAHRGASYDAPENTMAAFKLAWEQEADATELDIYLTKDDEVVAIHDATTKRTAGLDRAVAEQTMEELRRLDAGSWKGAEWRGERIPTLAESLTTIPDKKRVFIEIKAGPEILPALKRVLDACDKKPEQLALIGFKYDTMKAAKALLPKLQAYWVLGYKKDKETGAFPDVDELIAKARAANLDGLDLNHNFPIDAAFSKKVKDAGLALYVWTVNDAAVAKRMAEAGVDGITTDRPGWLRELLE